MTLDREFYIGIFYIFCSPTALLPFEFFQSSGLMILEEMAREKESHKAMHGARVDPPPPPSIGNVHQEALKQTTLNFCGEATLVNPLASHDGLIDVARHNSSFAKIMDDIAPTFGVGGQTLRRSFCSTYASELVACYGICSWR
ncbi:hypothetical protein GOP47_0016576 [Adiantum capillus-veneris]|uniref:Uncharacterized protein n=1 Tax=Adiantum capillus-veneris TaxID=13818 RepID=A0A9D4ZD43_ADICA|nr:hypothetical protein GOP47_0016576 [Adiantum capillus-veneris]